MQLGHRYSMGQKHCSETALPRVLTTVSKLKRQRFSGHLKTTTDYTYTTKNGRSHSKLTQAASLHSQALQRVSPLK